MKFRKKPVVIDAWVWNETRDMLAMLQFEGMKLVGNTGHRDRPGWVGNLRIKTLESDEDSFYVDSGDYIIKGVRGEFYPCKPDIFAATYEPAPSGEAAGEHAWHCDPVGPNRCDCKPAPSKPSGEESCEEGFGPELCKKFCDHPAPAKPEPCGENNAEMICLSGTAYPCFCPKCGGK